MLLGSLALELTSSDLPLHVRSPCFHIYFILFSFLSLFVLSLCKVVIPRVSSNRFLNAFCSLTNILTGWCCNVVFLFCWLHWSLRRGPSQDLKTAVIFANLKMRMFLHVPGSKIWHVWVGDCRVIRKDQYTPTSNQHHTEALGTFMHLEDLISEWRNQRSHAKCWEASISSGPSFQETAERLKVPANLELFAELHRFGRSL